MDCNLYYRDVNGKLSQISVTQAEDPKEAIKLGEELLVSEKLQWSSPILALIQGGKV
jgi:hypothetical protein